MLVKMLPTASDRVIAVMMVRLGMPTMKALSPRRSKLSLAFFFERRSMAPDRSSRSCELSSMPRLLSRVAACFEKRTPSASGAEAEGRADQVPAA